jgi:aspartate 1-decarboxylase
MTAAGLVEGEMVHVAHLNNGQRLETYVIEGPAGSGVVCLNGAAARCGMVGDQIILMAMAHLSEDEIPHVHHRSIRVDAQNRPLLDKVVS